MVQGLFFATVRKQFREGLCKGRGVTTSFWLSFQQVSCLTLCELGACGLGFEVLGLGIRFRGLGFRV